MGGTKQAKQGALAKVRCPACGGLKAEIRKTETEGRIYLSCKFCCGRWWGCNSIVRYLVKLPRRHIEFIAPWSKERLNCLFEFYERKHKPRMSKPREHYPIYGACPCPSCTDEAMTIRKTKKNECLYLVCTSCSGRLTGDRLVATYLNRADVQPLVQHMPEWGPEQLDELRRFYRL